MKFALATPQFFLVKCYDFKAALYVILNKYYAIARYIK